MATPPPLPTDPLPTRRGGIPAVAGLAGADERVKRAWKRRVAVGFGALLPGLGHLLYRRWWAGGAFLVVFASCFLTAVVLFLIGASHYFGMASDGNILEGDRLERLPEAFRPRWLVGLAIAGGVTWLAALLDLGRVLGESAPQPLVAPRARREK